MGAGTLLTSYHQLITNVRSPIPVLGVAVPTSMVIGLLSGHSILTTTLTMTPWAIYLGLILSDLYHIGSKLRKRSLTESLGDAEKQQIGEKHKTRVGQLHAK
jgi:hypothetical protein